MPMIEVTRTNADYEFTAVDAKGHKVVMDVAKDHGGTENGFRPMQLLLAGLGGCTAVDIVSILKKQKQEIQKLAVEIDGVREQGKEPSLWNKVELIFKLEGNMEPEKAYRAVLLSMDKYCSVGETLRQAGADIDWKVFVNGKEISSSRL